MLLYDYLFSSAERFPEKPAMITEGERIDYETLLARSDQLCAALISTGLKPGDRVILYTDNSAGYVAAYFGTLLAGGAVVGQSTGNRERQLKAAVNHCRASGIITSGRHIRIVEKVLVECPSIRFVFYDGELPSAPDVRGLPFRTLPEIFEKEKGKAPKPLMKRDDLAQIIYTSGTTAEPKGVMLSHKNLFANTESIIQYLELTHNDKVMVVLPFYYSYGNSLLLTHIACAGTLVIDNRFAYPEKVLERMREEEVTGFSGVPSTFAILVHRAGLKNHELPSLRYLTQAGGPMSPALARELQESLPKTKIFIMYGQTEASARLSYLDPGELLHRSGSIGKAIPGVDLTIRNKDGEEVPVGEVGEIIARGDNIMEGYWQNPSMTQEVLKPDGLHTGDLARRDEDGYLYIVSRKSDMIKSGAHRISPKEIEEVIMEEGRVHEVAVVGEPDSIMGETITALVVPKPGQELTDREIARICAKNLPPYKVPKKIEFRENLPKTASGKIIRHELRQESKKIH
ncbi:MAG: class I adenylate-forming enzyme family protein [Planctomycetota bacterium]|jgi:acyl-CoA synthetase (AMP-forming)/AMP-acid ligase II